MTDENCEEEISKLRRSNEDLRDFAHMAAHELQEPLRAMESFIGLLNEKYGAEMTPEAKEWLAETTDGASRMRQLIQSLLTFSSVDSDGIEFELISCADVLKTALIDLKPVIDAGQVQVLVESELPSIQGNAVLMSLLFRNLIGNSIKYCLEKPLIKIRAVAKSGEVIFEFVDNGIGFDMQYVDKIFKPFERLHPKANYPGTGLGLALCKRIIERHHGKIWVTSEVDKGSTFSFSLPKLQADA